MLHLRGDGVALADFPPGHPAVRESVHQGPDSRPASIPRSSALFRRWHLRHSQRKFSNRNARTKDRAPRCLARWIPTRWSTSSPGASQVSQTLGPGGATDSPRVARYWSRQSGSHWRLGNPVGNPHQRHTPGGPQGTAQNPCPRASRLCILPRRTTGNRCLTTPRSSRYLVTGPPRTGMVVLHAAGRLIVQRADAGGNLAPRAILG